MSTKEQNRTGKHRRYHARRSAGKCGQCGKFESRQSQCAWCREQHRQAPSRVRGTRPECKRAWRAQRRQQGLCADCGEPSKKFSRCFTCRSKQNAARSAPKKYKQTLEQEFSGGSPAWKSGVPAPSGGK